eukprot:7380216-Prymnesium_polylepis.1
MPADIIFAPVMLTRHRPQVRRVTHTHTGFDVDPGFFFRTRGTQPDLLEAREARRTRARTPHTCPVMPSTARSTLTYSTGD